MARCDVGETRSHVAFLSKLRERKHAGLADRNFLCITLWEQAVATGAKASFGERKLRLVIRRSEA